MRPEESASLTKNLFSFSPIVPVCSSEPLGKKVTVGYEAVTVLVAVTGG